MMYGRDAPIDWLPIVIGRVSVNCDWLVVAKNGRSQTVRSDDAKLDSLIYFLEHTLYLSPFPFLCLSHKLVVLGCVVLLRRYRTPESVVL